MLRFPIKNCCRTFRAKNLGYNLQESQNQSNRTYCIDNEYHCMSPHISDQRCKVFEAYKLVHAETNYTICWEGKMHLALTQIVLV